MIARTLSVEPSVAYLTSQAVLVGTWRVLADAAPEAIGRWSWWANGWSYAGLVLFWVDVGVKWHLERPAG